MTRSEPPSRTPFGPRNSGRMSPPADDSSRHHRAMETTPQDNLPTTDLDDVALSRRRFLRNAALTGGGLVAAAGLAACAPAAGQAWTFGPSLAAGSAAPSAGTSAAASAAATASAAASMSMAPAPSPSASAAAPGGPIPPGWTAHDIAARKKVQRYIGNLAPALKDIYGAATFAKLADILGAAENYPELSLKPAFAQVPQLVLNDAIKPLKPELDGNVKVFRLSIDEIEQRIDELMPPVAGLGYGGQWPGPTIRVTEGDKVRAIFTNNLKETTGVHFHGVEFDDFFQDGVPFVTQKPFAPGETYTYEFTANRPGSLMYHSHHNATDQVGRGLLGAFIVDPKNPTADDKVDRDYIWISNDELGGFTINGHGFPAVVPVLAAVGETVRVRFMNEGIMMHPWHSHGYKMKVVARDGYPLGGAAFHCDTLGVNPGERYDVNIVADRPGVWAFHCHILPHVEGADGMFGMVNTLIVVPQKAHVDAIVAALLA
jgi:FtsP/CotA-like multicopper oxidase with cupredoxin domain